MQIQRLINIDTVVMTVSCHQPRLKKTKDEMGTISLIRKRVNIKVCEKFISII
jgi:hypothetical protein